MVVCLPGVESCELFIYFGGQTLAQGIIGKYVFPYGCFSFYFISCYLFICLELQLLLGVISFHFNADFFSVQHFILMRFHLFIFSFMFLVLGDILVKILLHGISEIFLPMFSSRTFMVS